MIARLILILCLALAPGVAAADAQTVRDRIVRELRSEGYSEIRIYRTFLGRLRFVGRSPDARREIVVNPKTGVILRDYLRITRDDEDDDDDDRDARDEDDDEDDEDDENGSGSDDDDHDDDDDEDDEEDESDESDDESGDSDDSDDSEDSDDEGDDES